MLKNPFREIDNKNRKNSSDLLKKTADFNKIVNQRMKIVIIVVLCFFIAISVKLFNIQILENEDYIVKLEAFTRKQQIVTPPRGEIVDRNGNLLVSNTESLNITYYPPSNVSSYSESKWALAKQFAQVFQIKEDSITERDWKDFYLVAADNYGNDLLTEEELDKALRDELKTNEVYRIKINRVTQADIDRICEEELSEAQKNAGYVSNADKRIAWPVMMLMEKATSQESSVIVENASKEDVAYLVEHKEEFPGFDVTADWIRSYEYGSTLRDILGSVSTRGLDEISQDYYLAQGYALNERVGSSGLELQYEDYLRGTRTVQDISYDEESGIAIFSPSTVGRKGYNLKLTVDVDLQQKVDEILQRVLEREKDNEYRKNFKKAFVILMNPQNGEIITMNGQIRNEDGSFTPYASGNYLEAQPSGSVVKLATLYMGLNEGVVQPNEIIVDAPMVFGSGASRLVKQSAENKGPINDITAIAKSSNVYMFHIAIRLAGGVYVPNAPLYLPDMTAYDIFRKYYQMFGLGLETGIDIPKEEIGYVSSAREQGSLLDFAIGQYDTYTPVQLIQYVSTVGNGGYRVQPHFLKEVYEINSDESVIYQYETNVLNTVSGNLDYLERVKQGMRECVSTTFCGSGFKNLNKDIAAKTGTAEISTTAIRTNSAVVGFAPSNNPTISFVCSAPDSNNDRSQINICLEIMNDVLTEYYKTYE